MLVVTDVEQRKEWVRQISIKSIEDLLRMYEQGCLSFPAHFFIGDKNFEIRGPGIIFMEDENFNYSIRVQFENETRLLFT